MGLWQRGPAGGQTDGRAHRRSAWVGAEWSRNIPSSTVGWCLSPRRKLGQFPAPMGVAVPSVPSASTPATKVVVSGPWRPPGARGGRALTRAVLGHGIHAVSQHGLQTVHVPPHGGQVEPAARTRAVGLTALAPTLVPSPVSPAAQGRGSALTRICPPSPTWWPPGPSGRGEMSPSRHRCSPQLAGASHRSWSSPGSATKTRITE